jgi:hypothetical protein
MGGDLSPPLIMELMSGQASYRADVNGVSLGNQCQITTVAPHGYHTGDIVRITDLGCSMPVKRGMDQINDKRFLIYVNGLSTFLIRDPITHDYVNSTNYTPWVLGGRIDLEDTQYVYEGDEND